MSDSGNIGLLKPGESIKPHLEEAGVPQLLLQLYGLEAATIKKLVAYDDQNFLIKVKQSSTTNPHIKTVHSSGYVLKILNALDSMNPSLVDGQNAMMLHLSNKGYNCPVPQKTIQGEYISLQHLGQDDNKNPGKTHIVRLLTFIPGKILYDVTLTPDICHATGSYLARLALDLKDFSHSSIASRRNTWMMSETLRVRKFFYAFSDPQKLTLFTTAIDNWEKVVLPVMHQLPEGYIHGDFNEQNILVSPIEGAEKLAEPAYTITGVIDFGDISKNCYVFDLAIAVMGLLTMVDSNEIAGHVIAGYNSQRPLLEQEWDVLWECVSSRMCVSLVMGEYTHMQDPGNSYLLTTSKSALMALKSLLRNGKDATLQQWRAVV